MRGVTPLLKRVVYPSLARAGVLRRMCGTGLAVLTYHGIRPREYQPIDAAFDGNLIDAETFRKQLVLLKKNYTIVSPDDVLAWCEERGKLSPRAVLLTCDDGLLNNLTDMLPVLRQENLKCLFFVTGASAGDNRSTLWYEDLFLIFLRAPAAQFEVACRNVTILGDLTKRERRQAVWWSAVKRLSQVDGETRKAFLQEARRTLGVRSIDVSSSVEDRRFGLLVRDELRELAAAGMTIGAHTLNHPILSECPVEIAWTEIAESRTRLEAALQAPVWAMAYPFGDRQSVTPGILSRAREAGYKVAFMNCGGGLGAALPRHAIPRIHVTAQMNLAEFEANVAGFYAALQRRAGRNGEPGLQMAG
ncbi:MAG: polysaccharide deacetylase family protein [Candidatus Sulfotelmatobacter sp.]